MEFPKVIGKSIKAEESEPLLPPSTLQDKFSRWNLSERGSVACHRALRCLQNIAKFSRPAVVAAIHRVCFNGWPTARRMRNLLSYDSVQGCKLGCQHGEDSIEHYSSCRVFWSFCCSPLPRGLGIASRYKSKETFFMVNYDLCEEDILKLAHAIHALQNFVTASAGVSGVGSGNFNTNKALMLLVKHGASGYKASKQIFQPSRNATIYDIDTPILRQLAIANNRHD